MLKKLVTLCALWTALTCLAAIDLNQASEAELDSIKGVGPGTSSKILAERKKTPFKDWNDVITRVQGIGVRKAANFSAEGVTVNALPFAPVPPAKPNQSAKSAP